MALKFKENLPSLPPPTTCPPQGAVPPERQKVFRFIAATPPKIEDFLSYFTLGKSNPPAVDPCRWASCSVYTKRPAMNKLPRIRKRFKYFVEVEIDQNSGLIISGEGGHIDLWMFHAFDPLQAIRSCCPL